MSAKGKQTKLTFKKIKPGIKTTAASPKKHVAVTDAARVSWWVAIWMLISDWLVRVAEQTETEAISAESPITKSRGCRR
jgi:hypothetical protein